VKLPTSLEKKIILTFKYRSEPFSGHLVSRKAAEETRRKRIRAEEALRNSYWRRICTQVSYTLPHICGTLDYNGGISFRKGTPQWRVT